MSESRESSPLLADIGDDLDKALNEDEDLDDLEPEDEGDDEENDDMQDSEYEGILESDRETEDEARLLDRGEQLRLDEGGDGILEETQVETETETQETQDQDAQMRDVDESDGSDEEPLAKKHPAPEKRGRGRPPGKSVPKSAGTSASTSAKTTISEDNPLGRLPGKSLFPVSRVTKVIKADRDIPTVAKDAVFLISLATEEFIRRLAAASHNAATKENRTTVRVGDMETASKRIDEFVFLEDILPYCERELTKSKGNKGKAAVEQPVESGPMNQFIAAPKPAQKPDEDVVMQDETQDT